MTPRLIRLRRPVVLQVTAGPHVPDGADLDDVDRRWAALREENPAYFDGRMYHVVGVHRNGHGGAVMHVVDCAYRFHAVQDDAYDLGVRSLGVKGITVRDGRALLGRRSAHVAMCRGRWEFAPGGVVEPGREPVEIVRDELREETGLAAAREPTPVAVAYDAVVRTWEIVFAITPGDGEAAPATNEYDELRWCAAGEWPEGLSPMGVLMVPLVGEML